MDLTNYITMDIEVVLDGSSRALVESLEDAIVVHVLMDDGNVYNVALL